MPLPYPWCEFANSYDEIHALGQGFTAGFKTLLPWNIPGCPQKFTGMDPLRGYDAEHDEEAYYDGASVLGYCVKWVVVGLVAYLVPIRYLLG